jgi:predicted nucleic acid-binding Zn ribbon protein
MSEFRIIYKKRFPVQQKRADGTWGCRGCGKAIPKGRQTWCSNQCSKTFNPGEVLFAAKQRDKEICCECGYDAAAAVRKWWSEKSEISALYVYDPLRQLRPGESEPDNSEYWRRMKEWQRQERPRKIEYDHIIPFSEGGLTVLENIRSLCSICHKRRTRQWHKSRKRNSVNEAALAL